MGVIIHKEWLLFAFAVNEETRKVACSDRATSVSENLSHELISLEEYRIDEEDLADRQLQLPSGTAVLQQLIQLGNDPDVYFICPAQRRAFQSGGG